MDDSDSEGQVNLNDSDVTMELDPRQLARSNSLHKSLPEGTAQPWVRQYTPVVGLDTTQHLLEEDPRPLTAPTSPLPIGFTKPWINTTPLILTQTITIWGNSFGRINNKRITVFGNSIYACR